MAHYLPVRFRQSDLGRDALFAIDVDALPRLCRCRAGDARRWRRFPDGPDHCLWMCCTPSRNNKRHLPRRATRRYINHAHFGRCPGASSPTFCLGRHNKTCSDLQSKTRRRALQSDCGAQRLFECARLERRILGVLRRTGACSSALPHTPTRRELFCRRIVGPEMARIGFERNAALEERVFTIAFLSLMDGLKPIHSRRERRVH